METAFNINNVYQILGNYGIDKNFIKKIILPEWWEDEIANSKAGYFQTVSIISKNLGIDASELINLTDVITLRHQTNIKFKFPRNKSIDPKNIWPNSLAVKVSEIINQIYPVSYENTFKNALEIRNAILQSGKLDLANTLDFLWSNGIPVLHIPVFPKEVNKMDGMAVHLNGRPLIILSKNRKHDAWLLFILAHELGHIIKGHLSTTDEIIFDLNLESEEDPEEKAANEFAIELLNGTTSPSYLSDKKNYKSPFEFVNNIRPISKQVNVDPGVIALNYAYRTKKYALVEQALNVLFPKADAVGLVKSTMESKLELEKLSEENYDYFAKLTSISGE